MDYYFRFYTSQTILEKQNRCVLLAFPQKYYPGCGRPEKVIIKIFKDLNQPEEIQIHKYLSEHNESIIKVYDTWNVDNKMYLCIEYCMYGDLHHELERRNGILFDWPFVLYKCIELTNVLDFMHRCKLAHRDIKPLNVYITETFEFKLADFGEAKLVHSDEDFHTIRGTPYYMSPEVFNKLITKSNQVSNPYRDDIWALARTFIEIALGRLCPMINSLDLNGVKKFLIDEFRPIGYPDEFTFLIIEMMPQSIKGFINSGEVLKRLFSLYEKISQVNPEDSKDEYNDIENEVIYKSEQNESIDSPLSNDSTIQKGLENVTNELKFDLPILKNVSNESSDSESEIGCSNPPKRNPNQPNPRSLPVFLEQSQVSKLFVADEYKNSLNKNRLPDEVSINEESVIDPKEDPRMSLPNPKLQNIHSSPTGSNNKTPCKYCKKNYDDEWVLKCSHRFHKECLKNQLEKRIKKAKKIHEIFCDECKTPVSFDTITNFPFFDEKTKIKGNLLNLNITKSKCPECNKESSIFIVKDDFKPSFRKRCDCGTLFCSFCLRIGGHRWSCSPFDEYLKGSKGNIKRYINLE